MHRVREVALIMQVVVTPGSHSIEYLVAEAILLLLNS